MEIILTVGCVLAGLVIHRALAMHEMTLQEAEASEPGNRVVMVLFLVVAAIGGVMVFGGAL